MITTLLDVAYAIAAVLATPWLLYRRWVLKKPLAGWRDKLSGAVRRRHPERPCIWFHAVSVGEVLQLPRLIADYAARHPHDEIVISTTTGTGYEVACRTFPQHQVIYWPFDFSWAVDRSLRRIQPAQVVLVELEIWPNFLLAARRRQVPVVVINGRISARSFAGYFRWRRWLQPLFRNLSHVGAQTAEYAARFRQLGVPSDRVSVTGNLKFDRVESRRDRPQTNMLRAAFGLQSDELVFIAGSTQDPEESAALDCYTALAEEFPSLRLILVPRHKERFEDVARLVQSRGLPLHRRSAGTPPTLARPVLLLDTLGELAACWGLADIAFVGGSLTQRGGQNMLEPAGYGAAVTFGPNTSNFRDIVQELLAREAAVVIPEASAMTAQIRGLIVDANERERLGRAAQAFVLTQQGATQRTLDLIERQRPASPRRRAA